MSDEKNNKKKLEIVNGNISDLNISPVSEHITHSKQKEKSQCNNIIIPKGNKNK